MCGTKVLIVNPRIRNLPNGEKVKTSMKSVLFYLLTNAIQKNREIARKFYSV